MRLLLHWKVVSGSSVRKCHGGTCIPVSNPFLKCSRSCSKRSLSLYSAILHGTCKYEHVGIKIYPMNFPVRYRIYASVNVDRRLDTGVGDHAIGTPILDSRSVSFVEIDRASDASFLCATGNCLAGEQFYATIYQGMT